MPTLDASAIAQTIQLSVTPVFLLVATGSLLNVLAGRLSRVVDRSRVLMARWPETEGEEHGRVVAELRAADRRMRVINNSILAAVACGIVVCLLVALLFTQAFTGLNLGVAASWAFALAMLLLLVSLLLFLLEVRLAIRAIQVPMDLLEGEELGWLRRQRG
ncbi:DUF2721 domain-containing protein [Sphingopyxis sp. GW247-27LB]|uniref:DUF2721 domain-containing protein n=1 Tax=Sphingopyxis sp. GW247-27LB TaxID=2012632 RepID=UPI000BA76604|nr:DUF2721 domain-containing protein [Sphingopyxis sp. GW247-27LB]PAL22529.1 hypothetical protein CD928_10665 [Sphingopyxis sp. GW247-27LB]